MTTQTLVPLPSTLLLSYAEDERAFMAGEDAGHQIRTVAGYVYSGGTASTSGSLSTTVLAVDAIGMDGHYIQQADTQVTCTATMRTYVYLDSQDSRTPEVAVGGAFGTFRSRSGRLILINTPPGSGLPTLTVSLVPLCYLDSSASAITAVQDLRVRGPFATLKELLSPTSYGLVGDGVTDNTALFQAMHDALPPNSSLFFPTGTYIFSGTVNITKSLLIRGMGRLQTMFNHSHATADLFNIQSDSPVIFERLTLQGTVTKTAGAMIHLRGGASSGIPNGYSRFYDLTFNNVWDGIKTEAAFGWIIDHSEFDDYRHNAIEVANTISADQGDSTITSTLFNTTKVGSVAAIHHTSAGGLRILNNKFLGIARAYQMDLDPSAGTSDLQLAHNSIEVSADYAVLMQHASGVGTFLNVHIVGNQISFNTVAGVAIGPGGWCGNLVIADNLFSQNVGAGGVILNSGSNGNLVGNTFIAANAPYAINIAPACSGIKASDNAFFGTFTARVAYGNNPPALIVQPDVYFGTVAIAPGLVTAGAQVAVNVTIPGLLTSDTVVLQPPFAGLEAGLIFNGCVAQGYQVLRVFFYNATAGSITGASRTWGYLRFDTLNP
jgi:Pectate lyase superfamily protein